MTANAGLLGTDVTLNYAYLGVTSTDTISVESGVEVQCTGYGTGNAQICGILTAPNQSLDFDDFTITYNYIRVGDDDAEFLPGNPNGFEFLNLNLGSGIHNVLLDTTITGLDASRLSFTSNSIHLHMSDLALGEQESFTLRIVASPEPSASMLAGVGVLLLGVAQAIRKRRGK